MQVFLQNFKHDRINVRIWHSAVETEEPTNCRILAYIADCIPPEMVLATEIFRKEQPTGLVLAVFSEKLFEELLMDG